MSSLLKSFFLTKDKCPLNLSCNVSFGLCEITNIFVSFLKNFEFIMLKKASVAVSSRLPSRTSSNINKLQFNEFFNFAISLQAKRRGPDLSFSSPPH